MLIKSRYANQAASDAHLATTPVQDLIQLFTTGDVLAQAPEIHNCPITAKKTSGALLAVSSDPAIVLVNTPCKVELKVDALEEWRGAAEEAFSSSTPMSVFMVVDDQETKSVRAEYVLRSWSAFEEFAKNMEDYRGYGTGSIGSAELVKIRAIDGFIGREDKSKL